MSGDTSVTKKKNYVRKSKEELDKEINDLTSSTLEKIQSYTTSEKDILEYMDFMSRFHNYSPKNMSLIQTQFPGALGVGSFKKFKDAGFSVNKGEKGIKIFVPTPVELFQAEDGTTKYLTQATTEEKEKIKTKQLKVNKVQRYKLGTVFDISQTNATPEDLPKIFPNKHFNHDMKDLTLLKGMEAGLMNIGQELGVPIRNMDQADRELGNIKGVYVQQKTKDGTPLKEEIILNTRNTETENVGILIHELAHAKAHSSTKISTAEQEFQAEMISHVVSKHFGMDTTEEAVPYIADWSKNGQLVEDKVKSLEEIHSISRGFIETIESSIAEERIIAIERLEKEIEEKLERLNKEETIDIDSSEFEMQELKENNKSESEVMEYPESTYKNEVKEIFETAANEHPEFAVYSKDDNVHQLTIGDKRFSTSPFNLQTKSDFVFTEVLENEEWKLNLFVDTEHSIPEVVELVKNEIDQATNNRKEPGEIQKQKEIDNKTNLESEDFTENLNKAIKQRNYVSQEEVQMAKSVDILDFALSNGVSLEQDGNNYYRLTEHDSCVIDRRNNSFHWNSANVHGDSILFAQKIVGIEGFQDSVRALNGGDYEKIKDVEFKSEPYQYKTKEVPFNEAKHYLINERKIDTGIVTSLNAKGLMVQDERNNVVFKWCKDGEIVGASEQGIVKSDRYKRGSWKHVQENSESGQGFNFTIGKPENLKIFESSIDLLSYASIHKADLHDTRLVAMEGLKTSTVVTSINDSMETLGDAPKSISLCVDNDKAGHKFMKQFSSMQFKNNDGEIIPVTSEFPKVPEEKQVEGIDKWDWGNERVYQIEKKQDRFKGISKQTSGHEIEI